MREESTKPTVQLVGGFAEAEREEIQRAAQKLGMQVHVIASAASALGKLRAAGRMPAGVVLGSNVDARRFVEEVRDEAQLFALPLIARVTQPGADAFADALMSGVDDVVQAGDVGGLTRRLVHLQRAALEPRPEATRGRVVVCVEDLAARRRIGRTLRQTGFDVDYASDLEALRQDGNPPLFAVCAGAPPFELEHRRVAVGCVARIGLTPVLFLELDGGQRSSDAQIVDATGRLLMFADERTQGSVTERRGSTRKLYATVCSFREAGSSVSTLGATCNVSREGMYVRTFDPPRSGAYLWLELAAPCSGAPLHLRASAVWQRLPGSAKGVLPPGFGIVINRAACPPDDYAEFLKGYTALAG